MSFLYGLLAGAAGVVAYDLVSGYSVADFLKDLALRIFGHYKSMAEAKLHRLTAKVAKIRASF